MAALEDKRATVVETVEGVFAVASSGELVPVSSSLALLPLQKDIDAAAERLGECTRLDGEPPAEEVTAGAKADDVFILEKRAKVFKTAGCSKVFAIASNGELVPVFSIALTQAPLQKEVDEMALRLSGRVPVEELVEEKVVEEVKEAEVDPFAVELPQLLNRAVSEEEMELFEYFKAEMKELLTSEALMCEGADCEWRTTTEPLRKFYQCEKCEELVCENCLLLSLSSHLSGKKHLFSVEVFHKEDDRQNALVIWNMVKDGSAEARHVLEELVGSGQLLYSLGAIGATKLVVGALGTGPVVVASTVVAFAVGGTIPIIVDFVGEVYKWKKGGSFKDFCKGVGSIGLSNAVSFGVAGAAVGAGIGVGAVATGTTFMEATLGLYGAVLLSTPAGLAAAVATNVVFGMAYVWCRSKKEPTFEDAVDSALEYFSFSREEMGQAGFERLLKKEYLAHARVKHPDRRGGSQEEFVKLSMMFAILHVALHPEDSDEQKRRLTKCIKAAAA